ncbi:MAG: pirin family protein, partial [Pricia sp.]
AWFHLGEFEEGRSTEYQLKDTSNGLYVFVLKGSCTIGDTALQKRDGLGIKDAKVVSFDFPSSAKLLLMEVPMSN